MASVQLGGLFHLPIGVRARATAKVIRKKATLPAMDKRHLDSRAERLGAPAAAATDTRRLV